jgi:hypothetical protein
MYEIISKSKMPDFSKRRCADCYYCRAAITWWCTNEEIRKKYHTSIPGYRDCPEWKPARLYGMLSKSERGSHYLIFI